MEIFVGNLPSEVDKQQLKAIFESYGHVMDSRVITDKFSGISRGFGFVEMPNKEEALLAINSLSRFDLKGSKLYVSQAVTRSHMPKDHLEKS